MKKATAAILAGTVLLFLASLIAGHKLFSSYERNLSMSHIQQSEGLSHEAAQAVQKRDGFRKARLAFSSFDLMAGLTNQELENIQTLSLSFPFFLLLVCFWLILGLRKPTRMI